MQVDADAAVAAIILAAMPEVLFAYPVEFTDPMFARVMPTDRIVARLEADVTIDQIETPFGLVAPSPLLGSSVEYVLQVVDPKSTTPNDVVQALETSGLVEWAQRDCIREAEFYYTPTDPQFGNQWHLHANNQSIGGFTAPTDVDVNAPGAWNTTRGSASIKVAVIDDAIQTTHADLAANIDTTPGAEWDFFYNDNNADPDASMLDMHGTACAGVVGAVESNSTGVVGIAHQSPIVPIKLCDGTGNFPYDSGVAKSLRHAAQYADIITCSWGYVNSATSTLSSVRYALQSGAGGRGTVVFFATGNDAGYIPHMATLGAAGSYNLRWRYTKDATVSVGLDRCFVDSVWYPDGFPDHSEFVAGTLPLDSNSLLKVDFQQLGGASNVLAWGSVSGRVYSVDRSANLMSGFGGSLATNLVATPPTNTYSDAVLTTNAPVYYRLQVEN